MRYGVQSNSDSDTIGINPYYLLHLQPVCRLPPRDTPYHEPTDTLVSDFPLRALDMRYGLATISFVYELFRMAFLL